MTGDLFYEMIEENHLFAPSTHASIHQGGNRGRGGTRKVASND